MNSSRQNQPIDLIFYAAFRRAGLVFLGALILLTGSFQLAGLVFLSQFLSGMAIGTLLMWLTLHIWARVFFGASDTALGLQRMLWSAVLGLPIGICVAFGVVRFWPEGALGFGFGVCSPVFYAIWPIWRLRNHPSHQEQIP